MSRQRSSVATDVLFVWKASARMSAISRMCSRMSSGRPLSGRAMVNRRPWRAASTGLDWPTREPGRCGARPRARSSGTRPASPDPTRWPAGGDRRPAPCTRSRMLRLRCGAAVLEERVEGERRIHLHRHRRRGARPGDVRPVGHREVGLVVARRRLLAPEHQAWLHRRFAQAAGEHLVEADAAANLGTLRQPYAREQVARSARDGCRRSSPPR